jgi:hypothetical protein
MQSGSGTKIPPSSVTGHDGQMKAAEITSIHYIKFAPYIKPAEQIKWCRSDYSSQKYYNQCFWVPSIATVLFECFFYY